MGKNGVTISDVAKRFGVTEVMVSYVLNGRQTGVRISDGTRQTDTLVLVMQFPSVFSGWSGLINGLMHGANDAAPFQRPAADL